LLFLCLFSESVFAKDEKAFLVFDTNLNEIVDQNRGGYAELASLLKTYRNTKTPTFFIFGGASLSPSILSSFDQGAHIIDLLNSIKPDVMAASEGDFVYSESELLLRAQEAAFPLVQSNMINITTGKVVDGLLPSAVLEQGNYKLGFLSYMDKVIIEEYNLTKFRIGDPRHVIDKQAEALRAQGTDLVIMHYHGNDIDPVDFLENGTVDLVLRKNIHLDANKHKNISEHDQQVFIKEGEQVAIVELTWKKNQPQSLVISLQAPKLNSFTKHPEISKKIATYTSQLDPQLDEVVGITSSPMVTTRKSLRTSENAFGNLITDALKEYSRADVALLNSGIIRGEAVYATNSKITRRDIVKELPFKGKVVLLSVKGSQLISALKNGFSQIDNAKGRFPQVSGIQVTYSSQAPPGKRKVSLYINDVKVEPAKMYKLATSDYIANGGDGYHALRLGKRIDDKAQTKFIYEVVIEHIKAKRVIGPKVEGRIVDIDQ